jgi:hypothetical protein
MYLVSSQVKCIGKPRSRTGLYQVVAWVDKHSQSDIVVFVFVFVFGPKKALYSFRSRLGFSLLLEIVPHRIPFPI